MADKDKTKSTGKPKPRRTATPATDVKVEKKPRSRARAEAGADNAVNDMKDLGQAVAQNAASASAVHTQNAQPAKSQVQGPRVKTVDAQGRAYATGRRKSSVARVWLKPGSGKVLVNERDQAVYFARQTHRLILNQPFLIVNSVGHFDIVCTVKGGGLSGQAGAVRHGISRALQNFDPALRPALKKAGMLTRDARVVERKKVGKHKARRTKQWAKR